MKKYMISQIDIKNMIDKFNEIEKVKFLMFNEDQINTMESLDNPPSYYVHFLENKKSSIWKAKKKTIDDEMKFIESKYTDLKTIVHTEDANQFDKNLVKLFEFVYDMK